MNQDFLKQYGISNPTTLSSTKGMSSPSLGIQSGLLSQAYYPQAQPNILDVLIGSQFSNPDFGVSSELSNLGMRLPYQQVMPAIGTQQYLTGYIPQSGFGGQSLV